MTSAAYIEHLQDPDDGYANEQQRGVAAAQLERQCAEPCGGWFYSPFDSIERCPCCPDTMTAEDAELF